MSSYFRRVLIGIDQFFNTLFNGQADETLSSRMGRLKDTNTIANVGCKILDLVDKNHCVDSIEYDLNGNPTPHHLEKIIEAKVAHKEEAREIRIAMIEKGINIDRGNA